MITGSNTNVRYRGILFHVQTEDSGRANPHIISHLYHGGTILGSEKTDYSDRLEADDLLSVVRSLIETQHAEMLEKLNSGGFDPVIAERLGEAAASAGIEAGGAASKSDTEPELEPEPVAAAVAAPPTEVPVRRGERGFGEGVASDKPLDEVILEYLADKARRRASGGGAAPKSRSRG